MQIAIYKEGETMRIRTVNWMEGKILAEMRKQPEISTYLALSANVLENMRFPEEQDNLDIAVVNLISRGLIQKSKDDNGFTVFMSKAA